ncbi:hypothetical protein E2P84_40885 [Burkholderia cepacia]|uniref:Uncharacterized protein n=1 Tax=Burkholderia cepacia TaxID=292 RepID=A0AAX2RCH9_BURCE|nr:hypothetical protein [Burkholderia cepacia]TES62726.1 hypothetical protein E2P84_40885 [Burkholderia cepacia]TES96753.1 hypothetical protein E3D36_34910 [Burkholderia cepacia]TEU34441.1 hypothetical protein E3D37_39190 [Burkholderia cepacia]TEU38551.1 hypothetical protein E3D38_37760 [Burkholderia cepacia]TEU87188.1 hypothetical protein E3D40_39540 [Burkholderia cepacia]
MFKLKGLMAFAMNTRGLLLALVMMASSISNVAAAPGEEKDPPPVKCLPGQQKVYVTYMFKTKAETGYSSAFLCTLAGEHQTEVGMNAIRHQLEKALHRGLMIQNVMPMKG